MTAKVVRNWSAQVGATPYIEPGSLWENSYCESFNGNLRDELLNREILYTLKEAQIVIGFTSAPQHCQTALIAGYRPTAPQAFIPILPPLDQGAPMQ